MAMWNPFWLSRPVLTGVIVTCSLIIVALVLPQYVNTRTDGFPLITSNHYVWTYGPTAILVLVVSAWRQIDHACKVLMPWKVLREGSAQSQKSILLDYISPLQVLSFWEAVRNGHWLVCNTIITFVFLKLITVASTGLFTIDVRTLFDPNTTLVTTTSFDGSLYNASAYLSVSDSSLFYNAYAVMAKGLDDTEGVLGTYAYQAISTKATSPEENETTSAIVDVFAPAFNCEKAQVAINLQPANTTDQHPEDTFSLLSPACQLLAGAKPAYALNPQVYTCPARQLSGVMQRVDCSGQNSSHPVGNWQLLTMTDMRYGQKLANASENTDTSTFQALEWSTGVSNVSSVVCRPSYTMQRRLVTYARSNNNTNITLGPATSEASQPLNGFGDADLGVVFTSAYIAAALMFGNKADSGTAEEYPDTMFKTMADVIGGTYETLLDPDAMATAAEKVFNHVAVQIATKNLVRHETSPIKGQTETSERRLFIRPLPLWLMVGGLSIVIILSILTFFMRPYNVVTHDPEPITSTALLLGESPMFEDTLITADHAGTKELSDVLSNHSYGTIFTVNAYNKETFAIEVHNHRDQEPQAPSETSVSYCDSWWTPLLLRWGVLLPILGLPLVLIAILEALQHLSGRSTGITQLQNLPSIVTDITTRFLPALIMLLVSTSFNALDFNIVVLAPYHSLKAKAHSAVAPILGQMPPAALWTSFRSGYWSALFSSIGALLGSVLTIVVSGLLVLDTATTTHTASLQAVDSIQPKWTNSVTSDSSAAVVVSLIEAANLSYPSFTYEDIALPQLRYENAKTTTNNSTLIDVQVPSYRGSLSCDMLRPHQFNVSSSFNPAILTAGATVEASVPLPPECPYGGPGGNLTTIDFNYFFQLPAASNQSFAGKLLDLHVGPYSGPFAVSSDEVSPFTQPDNPAGCPSLALIYGYIDAENDSNTIMSTMACSQVIERVDAQVTMNAKDLSISTSRPPIVNESSATRLASGPDKVTADDGISSTPATAFPFRIQVHMDQTLSMFNQTQYSSSSISSLPPVDNFFQAVLFGRTPIPQDLLRQTDQASQDEIMQGIQNFYRRYMAQAISANMRVNLSSTATSSGHKQDVQPSLPTSLQAKMVDIPTNVVRQNNTSKITLQVLLGVMFACGLAAVLLNPTQKVVRHNPCTIAGSASLFAGSGLVKELAAVAVAGTEPRTAVLRRRKVRLGWWYDYDVSVEDGRPRGEGRNKRYGIDFVPAGGGG
ncbi:hypothetical protein H2204_003053 [Knufia peltigerae]|uniref:Uncharacterized protein n=1 Tax=Knufia peltigerae TaxID=1002370 RepID=A0AA38YBK1_9EURO|nr:hypothetical protein H2204_003053 [Knufia peltigerae]